jgi:hypothetical protein
MRYFLTKIQDCNTNKDLRIILNYVILNYDCSWKYKCNVSQGILVLRGQRTSIATTQTKDRVKNLSITFYMSFPLQIFLNQMP